MKRTWDASVSRIQRQLRHQWESGQVTSVSHQVLVTLVLDSGPEAGREIQVWMDVTEALRHIVAVTDAALEADTRNRESEI